MELRIQAVHFDMSEQLKSFVEKKTERIAKLGNNIVDIDVTLRLLKPEAAMNKEAGVKLHLPQKELVSTKTADTFEEAVDLAIDALKGQLEKAKNK